METEYRIFKFKNGDTIISELNSFSETTVTLHRPMLFKTVTMLDDNMNTSDVLIFKNWAEFSTEKTIEISTDMIGASWNPDVTILNCYEMEKIKQDMPEVYKKMKKLDPELPKVNPPINPFLPGLPMPGLPKNNVPSNMANFNLTLPIDVAKGLIEYLEQNGINLIGPDFDDIDNLDEDNIEDLPPEEEPFGNHPDDWSPDPSDYLK